MRSSHLFPLVKLIHFHKRRYHNLRNICTKRVYTQSSKNDGARVLVDRIWPRGFSRSSLEIDIWFKDIAPSSDLRKWFGHDPDKWQEFKSSYIQELDNNRNLSEELLAYGDQNTLTLLYAAKDEVRNHAQVLCEYLKSILAKNAGEK